MAHYIDKDALVAEIESLKSAAETMLTGKTDLPYWDAQKYLCEKLLSFIDSLEAKEVVLEKVFNDEYSKFSNDTDAMDYAFPIDLADFKDFAKHFFELGLKSKG